MLGTTWQLLPLEGRSQQFQGMSPLFKTILVVSLGHRIAAIYQNLQSLRLTWLGGFTPTQGQLQERTQVPIHVLYPQLASMQAPGSACTSHLAVSPGRSLLKCCHPLGPGVIKTRQSFHCVNAPGGQAWFHVTAMVALRSAEGNYPQT